MKLLRISFAAAILGFGAAASAQTYSSVVAFGDSLSDNGNLYRLIDGLTPFTPNDGQPPLPYFYGRFSNGPTAVELVAEQLAVPLEDHAVGGAKTGPDLTPPPAGPNDNEDPRFDGTGTLAQVQQAVRHPIDRRSLYVVWAGANDFLASSADLASSATAPHAVANLTAAIQLLYRHGARHFLVPGMADLGLTPSLTALGPVAVAAGTGQSSYFNLLLSQALASLNENLEGADIRSFDTAGLLRTIVADPAGNGFADVTDECIGNPTCILTSFNSGPAAGYLFWDGVHPTAVAHQILAGHFFAVVAPAATPASASPALGTHGELEMTGVNGHR